MDILLTNFPHMFPKDPDFINEKKAASNVTFEGDGGVAEGQISSSRVRDHMLTKLDEGPSVDDVEHVEQEFLDSIIDKVNEVELKCWMYYNRYEGHTMQNPLKHDTSEHLKEALAIMYKVMPEMKRLEEHPEVFSDVRQKEHFFLRIGKIMHFCVRLMDIMEESKALIVRSQKRIDGWTNSNPINPWTKQPYQPWESFGRKMPLLQDSPAVKEIQKLAPDMRMIAAQQLPQNGVLIGERYRQKQERIVTDIMRQSPRPEVVEKQLPSRDAPISGEKVVEGMSAKVRRPAAMVPMNDNTKKAWAFGKQEHIAEMGRLMALYDGDVTTQNRVPPAAFQATFLSAEGMRAVQEARDLIEENREEN
ncbi:hypothetical protein HII31_01798 [Pseudocercospora fuligena]|uniref:Uncharacterized protein n=1 Tax=Pseudocercospora fuligena TaxID=685502 RepID=A0A8H6VS62_9PEZI|nr:hypothetical protein HII31_01798 [Pseudocercospora fuligena]